MGKSIELDGQVLSPIQHFNNKQALYDAMVGTVGPLEELLNMIGFRRANNTKLLEFHNIETEDFKKLKEAYRILDDLQYKIYGQGQRIGENIVREDWRMFLESKRIQPCKQLPLL